MDTNLRSSRLTLAFHKGSVVSPLLFIIFLNDFLGIQAQKFKFVDDSSLIVSGKDPSDLSAIFRKTCSDTEK